MYSNNLFLLSYILINLFCVVFNIDFHFILAICHAKMAKLGEKSVLER